MTATCQITPTHLGHLAKMNVDSFILTSVAINFCITQRQHTLGICMCMWFTEQIQVKEASASFRGFRSRLIEMWVLWIR